MSIPDINIVIECTDDGLALNVYPRTNRELQAGTLPGSGSGRNATREEIMKQKTQSWRGGEPRCQRERKHQAVGQSPLDYCPTALYLLLLLRPCGPRLLRLQFFELGTSNLTGANKEAARLGERLAVTHHLHAHHVEVDLIRLEGGNVEELHA